MYARLLCINWLRVKLLKVIPKLLVSASVESESYV